MCRRALKRTNEVFKVLSLLYSNSCSHNWSFPASDEKSDTT